MRQDPTANVIALSKAAHVRQDDLRNAHARLVHAELRALRRMASMREQHDRELREAEAKRIDAIRLVDVQAVQRAAEEQRVAAATLATQVAVSAETLRTQVATTAAASRAEFITALAPITTAIEELRRAQYETQGQKSQVVEGRATSADSQPILEAIRALQATQLRQEGATASAAAHRENFKFYFMLLGAASAGLAIWNVIISIRQ